MAARTRWIGDLSTCFLLDAGWAFKLRVNSFLLKGKPGWQMPISVAEALGLATGETMEFACRNDDVDHVLWVTRREKACVGGELDFPLKALGCEDRDIAFVAFSAKGYRVIAARVSEKPVGDPLGELLWSCGLDPADAALRFDPWGRLTRVLGGGGGSPEAVTDRLQRRGGDGHLISLVEEASALARRQNSDGRWPHHWQYTAPPAEDSDLLALRRGDGMCRVLVGIVDATAQPAEDLVVGDGGTLWLEVSDPDSEKVVQTISAPPKGLVPAAARRSWNSWLRAEHRARRLALAGLDWNVPIDRLPGVLEALLALPAPHPDQQVTSPPSRIDVVYPHSGSAFAHRLEVAADRGLAAIRADGSLGFRVVYADGRTVEGLSLPAVLADD